MVWDLRPFCSVARSSMCLEGLLYTGGTCSYSELKSCLLRIARCSSAQTFTYVLALRSSPLLFLALSRTGFQAGLCSNDTNSSDSNNNNSNNNSSNNNNNLLAPPPSLFPLPPSPLACVLLYYIV